MTIPIMLSVPPRVLQNDPMGCWAAAFNSWTRAQGLSSAPNEQRMIEMFGQLRGVLYSDNGAQDRGIRVLSSFAFMSLESVRGSRLTAQYFADKLEREGHIYLAYKPIGDGLQGGHVVVVYGVTQTHALVMDPDPSVVFPCHVPIDWYLRRRTAFVGTSVINTRTFRNPFN